MASYDDNDIALKLPGDWTQLQNSRPDLLQFRESSGQRQLSVSLMTIGKQSVSPAEIHEVVQRLYAHRVEAERRALAVGDPLLADGVRLSDGVSLGIFSGVQKASSRCFIGYVTAKGKRAVVLYLESITRDFRAHLQLGNDIFMGLTIKSVA